MGFTYYRSMVLIPEDHGLTFSDLVDKLKKRFSGWKNARVEVTAPSQIVVRRDEWSLRVDWEDQPHVLVESREIAEQFIADEADREIAASCRLRITTAGASDPGMAYFNDYVFVLEVLKALPGVYILDPDTGEIRKTG